MTVFVLQHMHSFEDGNEDVKFIGVYSSRVKAEEATARFGKASGFSECQDGFCIDAYELDKDQWVEGYATLRGGVLDG